MYIILFLVVDNHKYHASTHFDIWFESIFWWNQLNRSIYNFGLEIIKVSRSPIFSFCLLKRILETWCNLEKGAYYDAYLIFELTRTYIWHNVVASYNIFDDKLKSMKCSSIRTGSIRPTQHKRPMQLNGSFNIMRCVYHRKLSLFDVCHI